MRRFVAGTRKELEKAEAKVEALRGKCKNRTGIIIRGMYQYWKSRKLEEQLATVEDVRGKLNYGKVELKRSKKRKEAIEVMFGKGF